jgi:glycosyltransferase involved in cell wall biosynthesis
MQTATVRPRGRTRPCPSARPRRKLAIVSTYPPRECGIATFTHDLREGLAAAAPDLDVVVCAVDRDGLSYGPEAVAVLDQDDPASYPRAAKQLAAAGVDAVLIQHEFGIFGGPDGSWVDDLAAELTSLGIPYLATLHTVVSQPTPHQAKVLRQLCESAAAVTVFTPTARRLATATGLGPADRFHIVPHGAPAILRPEWSMRQWSARHDDGQRGLTVRPEVAAVLADTRDATVASTFGLLSPGKGLHTGIEAVARVAADVPDLRYIIAGATHPEIVRKDGESYRESLERLADQLGVRNRVTFLDFFLTDAEIAALLGQTSVFLTPYRSSEQISSGALTFALAAGVPAVSTAYHYATDLLAGGAGITTPCGDTGAFTDALRTLLTQPGRLAAATSAARAAGDRLAWSAVAGQLAGVIAGVTGARAGRAVEAAGAERRVPASPSLSRPAHAVQPARPQRPLRWPGEVAASFDAA